jgi:hypothetical protein
MGDDFGMRTTDKEGYENDDDDGGGGGGGDYDCSAERFKWVVT